MAPHRPRFVPVSRVGSLGPMAIGVYAGVPVRTLPALIALARQQPGGGTYTLAYGQVQMMFNGALALVLSVMKGRERLLAQTGANRSSALLPDLHTVGQALALPSITEMPIRSARKFGSFLAAETERFAGVIKTTGLQLNTPDR